MLAEAFRIVHNNGGQARVEEIRAQKPTGRYGLRIENQEEFEQTIRKPEDEK